jgi:hypothetical protein
MKSKGPHVIPVGDALLKQIRMAHAQPGVTRVVLDLAQPVEFIASQLSNPDRMMIDLRSPTLLPPPTTSVTTAQRPPDPPAARQPEPVVVPPAISQIKESLAPESSLNGSQAALDSDAPETLTAEAAEPPRLFSPPIAPAIIIKNEIPAPKAPGNTGVRKIVALQGKESINNIRTGTAIEPVVEVRDGRDIPVANADVTFQLPTSGPGGFFPGPTFTLNTRTNDRGQAAGTGIRPNNTPGRFSIRVTTPSENQLASLLIPQRNASDDDAAKRLTSANSRALKWRIVAIAGSVALTAGIIVATHSGGSSPAPQPNSLTVGTGPITISGPH